MKPYLWLSIAVCCVVVSACGPVVPGPDDTCEVDADCFPDELCKANRCTARPKVDAGDEDAGVDDAGTTGGGGGEEVDAGPVTGGGTGVDSGTPDCESGDTRACCSGRGQQTCDSAGTWTVCDAPIASETCNGIDDDCNGTVDNDVLFSMPDGGVAMNVACSIGVGACLSNGSLACGSDGGVECGATVIQPTTETCDGIDNDCDGDIDEGTKVLCQLDADNDHYAGSSVQQQLCPDVSRPDFGNCPIGYVATSQGTDCNDNDANTFQIASIALDADNDSHCIGLGTDTCIGTNPPATYRLSNTCISGGDCDDSNNQYYQLLYVKSDSDGDGYCVDNGNQVCSGATPRPGSRLATACQTTYDCNDGDNQKYRTGQFRLDFDGDTFCNDTMMYSVCYGSSTPTHYATSCPTTLDCNDFDTSLYQNVNLRVDADNDSYCTSAAAVLTCIGTSVPSGKRLATQCNATADCKDTNYYATSSCTKSIVSNTYDKLCDVGQYVTTNWDFSWSCGTGFHTTAAQFNDDNSTDGDDAYYTAESYNLAASTAHSDFTCRTAAVGHDYFSVNVTCSAD